MPSPTQQLGTHYEQRALEHLQTHGLMLIDHHYNSKGGELDLILQDNDCLVFTEVRFRHDNRFGGSVASVTQSKQAKIKAAAKYWLMQNKGYSKNFIRFDVVGIDGPDEKLTWIQNAFY